MSDAPLFIAPLSAPDCPTANGDRPGILVVDDEPAVRDLLHLVLSQRGFQVWTAAAGPTALELYRRHQPAVHVALLDVCMPDMDGPQVLAELRRIHPGVRVAFMSGFTGRYTSEELLAMGVQWFFEKPFAIHALSEKMWQLALTEVRRSA